jgi:ubiquinone/menaquinone biosynthesis C-methylase UbiE
MTADTTTGWANPATAKAYAEFCRRHDMYRATSTDIVELAGIGGDQTVVDLACGTGQTTEVILERLGDDGTIHAVDGSTAMLGEAQTRVTDPRVRWHESGAEALADRLDEDAADAVVCNSAIWQTDMAATFASVRAVLRPGGRFVCNIGRQFLMMPFTDEELNPETASFHDLMHAIAVLHFGHVPRPPAGGGRGRRGPLTAEVVCGLLRDAGFEVVETPELRYTQPVELIRDWLHIPVFTEFQYPDLTVEQRLAAADEAYERVDRRPMTSRWVAFVATNPG